MKKYVFMISAMITVLCFTQCRPAEATADFSEEFSEQSISPSSLRSDSLAQPLYPDPPVRDGHDWRQGK